MTDIILSTQNGEPVASSRQIAESFGKEHKDVLRAIENIKAQNCALTSMFFETTYTAGTGKAYPMYLMNRDGFTLLAMGFTGKAALEWKLKYIAAFNAMERKLTTPAANQLQDLSPELQYLIKLERQQNQQAKQLEQVNERLDAACEAFSLSAGPDWKKVCQNVISSAAMKRGGTDEDFEAVWNEIYEAMERRGFNLDLRVSNAKSRAIKNGICKSDVRKISKARIIEAGGKKLICAFVDSVRELAAKTGTRVDKLDEIHQTTLFDRNCAPAGRLREGGQNHDVKA
nr:MAG TPA: regulatory protein [Caudoviricetes sp.]